MSKDNEVTAIAKGFKDMLPKEQEVFTYFKKVVRHRCRQSGFRRISTPVIEYADLFRRGLGEHSRLAARMFILNDEKGNQLALRPEGTIPVLRAYFGNKMQEWPQPVQLYYIEPYFRLAESSSSKSPKEFFQFGAEVIGESDTALEAQLMDLSYKILQDLGIAHLFTLKMTNLGCSKCKEKYEQILKDFYFGKERSLCDNCLSYLETNPIRLLECEEEDCKILAQLAPKFEDYRCSDCVKSLKEIQSFLNELNIPFQLDPTMIGVVDYYNGNIFEYRDISREHDILIGGGGAFDGLSKKLGYPGIKGFGFCLNIDKVIEAMRKEKVKVPSKDNLHVFVAQLGQEAKKKCLTLMDNLREAGIKSVGTLAKGSMRDQITAAEQFQVPYMTLMGLSEVREGTVIIKDMKAGRQKIVKFDEAVDELTNLLGKDTLDTYSPEEVLY